MASQNLQQIQVLLDGPALAPPPGTVSQFDNPPNAKHAQVADLVIMTVLATTVFILRLATKLCVIRQIKKSDYAISIGWALFIGYTIPLWLILNFAPQVHQWDLRLKDFVSFLWYVHVASVIYGFCIFFIKLAILLQYLEIFVPNKKSSFMYWACHFLIWFNLAFYLAMTLVEIFACQPMAKAWDPLILEGHCVDILAINWIASSINSASDIGILVLPQLVIWKLQINLRKKLAISAIFLIGVIACMASILRLAYCVVAYLSSDVSYNLALEGAWTSPEMSLGIVVACLPTLPKLFQKLNPRGILARLGDSFRSLLGRSSHRSQTTAEAFPMHDSGSIRNSTTKTRGG